MDSEKIFLKLKRLGIDTYQESVIYMRYDCLVCKSEGFEARSRIKVTCGEKSIIATLNMIKTDILGKGEIGLSEYAFGLLKAREGEEVSVSHARHVKSLSYVRSKIYGNKISASQIDEIIRDITAGRYSDIHLSSFLTACAGDRMDNEELVNMTKAMVEVGEKLSWDSKIVVDKHSVGGLPGNRTTPIIVSIVAEFGLTMPKTSSRAITSPAGTADTMSVLTSIKLDTEKIKKVVKKENGCIAWGGHVFLSPADDIMIGVERALNLDSEGQMVASILSKKIAAGSTHVVIDVPVGPTAKVRSQEMGQRLKNYFELIGKELGIEIKIVFGDGTQPIGRGIGPALEARDLVQVLQNDSEAPQDLRERALVLAGKILEFSEDVKDGEGIKIATEILETGKALKKFKAICMAQGGFFEIPKAAYTYSHMSEKSGAVTSIDNRRLALIAKLAGAPKDAVAGVDLKVNLGDKVEKSDELFVIHAESPGELQYAIDYLLQAEEIIKVA